MVAGVVCCVLAAACSDPETEQLKKTTIPTYDKSTGKLKELTFDFNKNGKIDTWTEMDGARPVRARMDLDEDGTLDRWEYYDVNAKLVKVGFSRRDDGKPDAWAFQNAQGQVERVEASSAYDEQKIDRWEIHKDGVLHTAEEDVDLDGVRDRWETYEAGVLKTAAFDEDRDGRPDRRLTYDTAGAIVLIETEPDGKGLYQIKTIPQGGV